MQEDTLAGGCLCGAVRYAVTGPGRLLCYCHCSSCRRATGAPLVPWGTFARERFRVVRGALAEYRSSPPVLRGFCAGCGTPLTYWNAERPGDLDVALVTLDAAATLAPLAHVWVSQKLPWVVLQDGLPQYPRGFDSGALAERA